MNRLFTLSPGSSNFPDVYFSTPLSPEKSTQNLNHFWIVATSSLLICWAEWEVDSCVKLVYCTHKDTIHVRVKITIMLLKIEHQSLCMLTIEARPQNRPRHPRPHSPFSSTIISSVEATNRR